MCISDTMSFNGDKQPNRYAVRYFIDLSDSVSAAQLPAAMGLDNAFQIVHNHDNQVGFGLYFSCCSLTHTYFSFVQRDTFQYQCDTEDDVMGWLEALKQVNSLNINIDCIRARAREKRLTKHNTNR
jgi:hypothetical protein